MNLGLVGFWVWVLTQTQTQRDPNSEFNYIHFGKNKQKVKQVIDTVIEQGGIQYAETKMNEYRDEALQILHEFENTEVKKALEDLVRYTTDRKY
mgnify:CR=1 FL=1